jgi:hypothetical protein
MLKKIIVFSIGLLGVPALVALSLSGVHRQFSGAQLKPSTAGQPADRILPTLRYRRYPHPRAVIHTLTVPPGDRYSIRPVVVDTLQTVEQLAARATPRPLAILNGGYFDPHNQKSTSFVVRDERTLADPQTNERFVANDSIIPELDKILNRSEFRRYRCQDATRYAITPRAELPPPNCQLIDSLGAGPQLLPQLTAEPESFWQVRQGKVVRDPIGLQQPNARSAIGLTAAGDVVWVAAAQNGPTQPGLSLPELAKVMRGLGAVTAMNLDGGSSTSLYYAGQAFYGKRDAAGQPSKRGVKSMLVIQAAP